MGDPVGNFHYVEKRLKQGITVTRGGEGGGWPRTENQKKPLQDVEMVSYIMSPRKREKKTAIRTVITIQQWYIRMENRNNLTRPKSSPSCRASLARPIASAHKSEDRELITKIIILTLPSGSGIRNKAATKDDFPAPVRPTTPTFSLAATLTFMSSKILGAPFKYANDRSRNVKEPVFGQSSGGWLSVRYPGSGSILV